MSIYLFMLTCISATASKNLNTTSIAFYRETPIVKTERFPFREFFKGADNKYLTASKKHLLCSSDIAAAKRCCDCNKRCVFYGTCCIDAFWKEIQSTKENIIGFTEHLLNKSSNRKRVQCEKVQSFVLNKGDVIKSYLMVASCQSGVTEEYTRMCLQGDNSSHISALPVIGSDNYMYKNQYCALCNFVDGYHLARVHKDCNRFIERSHNTSFLNDQLCVWSIRNSRMFMYRQECEVGDPIYNKGCSSRHPLFELCNSYIGSYLGYANYHCWLCSRQNITLAASQCLPLQVSTTPPFYLQPGCLLRRITKGVIIDNKGNLIHHYETEKNITYPPGEFSALPHGYAVCTITGTQEIEDWLVTFRAAEGYISLTGTCVSIVSYLIPIITFAYCKELHTIPNFGILSLCVCMVVSDILFLTANILHIAEYDVSPVICEGIAICMHFALLCALVCAVLITVSMAMLFGGGIQAPGQRTITFKKYFTWRVFTFLLPLIMVIISVTLNKKEIINVGYGENGLCILTGYDGRLAFYVIPAIISFVCAVFLLAYTLKNIYSEIKRNSEVLGSSGGHQRSISVITLKVIIVHGVIEGVGFIQLPTTNHTENYIINSVFAMIFSILRSFRGVILLCFAVSIKEVIKLYRKKFPQIES